MRTMAMRLAILVGLVAGATPLAEAGSNTYEISGQFGPDLFGSGPLAGGSFQGTFSAAALPVPAGDRLLLNSFDVVLKDSQGQSLYELTPASYDGEIEGNPYFGVDEDLLHIGLASNPFALDLNLYFAAPFNGVGTVIPHTQLSPTQNLYSGVIINEGSSVEFGTTISGSSSLAASVPEPSGLILALMSVGAVGLSFLPRQGTRADRLGATEIGK